jgi:hypothetical protein
MLILLFQLSSNMDALLKNLALGFSENEKALFEKPDEWIQVDGLLPVNPVVESTEFAYKVCHKSLGVSYMGSLWSDRKQM